VLAIGDSQTEALFLNDEETFSARLEQLLQTRNRNLQVLNAGRSGVSLADHIFFAPRFKRLFHPRWTIVELTESDLTDDAWHGVYARFARNGDRLVITPPPQPRDIPLSGLLGPKLTAIIRRTMLIRYASYRIGMFRKTSIDPPWFRAATVAQPKQTVIEEYPIEEELQQLMSAYDGRVTVLYLSPFDPQHPKQLAPLEEKVMELCSAHGWSCVSPRSSYESFAGRHDAPFGFSNSAFNEGHLNAAGHTAAAAALNEELRRLAGNGVL
jgi:lysophospholipase L1-like esterase